MNGNNRQPLENVTAFSFGEIHAARSKSSILRCNFVVERPFLPKIVIYLLKFNSIQFILDNLKSIWYLHRQKRFIFEYY